MDHTEYEMLGRRKGKFNPQIYLNKKVFEIDNSQLKLMQQMDLHDISKLVSRILKKAIANRENDDVTVLYFYFKDSDFVQKLQNKFDEQTSLQIISHITYKKCTRHEQVCKQGQGEKQMYFILEGKACMKRCDACQYEKQDGSFGIRKVCLSKKILSKGDTFCQEILKGSNYDENKICTYSVSALDLILECAVLRRDHYLGFKISMGIKQEINKVNLIQSSTIFNYHLNPRQLKALSSNFHLKKSYCNNIIYTEGDDTDGIYIIKSGRFKLQKSTNYNYNFDELDIANFKMASAKKYSEVAVLGEGQCFGDEELLKNIDKRMFTVTCETASGEFFVISKKDFYRVLSSQFKDEDWKEIENAFKLKNDWRKENISSIEKVKQQFVDYMGAPPKYSGEAKLLKLIMSSKKQQSPVHKNNASPKAIEAQSNHNVSTNDPQKTFELTQINQQDLLLGISSSDSSQQQIAMTPSSKNYQKKIDSYLNSRDIQLSKQKIDTDYGFYRRCGGSSLGMHDESDTRHNTSFSMSSNNNTMSNQFGQNQLKSRHEKIPSHLRSQSVQEDKNLLRIGQMIKERGQGNTNFLPPANNLKGLSPLQQSQNQYPHQNQLILPEINYKEHSTIDVRHRHPSPFSSLTKRQTPNGMGMSYNRNGFYSNAQSPTSKDHRSLQYYDGTNGKKNSLKMSLNYSGNNSQLNTSRNNTQYYEQDTDRKSQSPSRYDDIPCNFLIPEFNIDLPQQLPLKRMDIADLTHNKAIILKTKNFTADDEKGRVIAFEGTHFVPTELDNNYLEKKGIIKKKYDPKKREIENQQSMEKGKKILENFILGYLTKKKKAQSIKKVNRDEENNDEPVQVQMYSFPQGKTNTQFYSKSRNKFKRRLHTNNINETALSPQSVPQNPFQSQYLNEQQLHQNNYKQQYSKQSVQYAQQVEFSPQLMSQNLKENSTNQLMLITLEKSPTKLSIQDSKTKGQQESIYLEQSKKQSQKSIFTGKNFNSRKSSKQKVEI